MSEKVVSLAGHAVAAPGEPVPYVVEMAERLLADCRAGRVRAFLVAEVMGNGRISRSWAFGLGDDLLCGSALFALQAAYMRHISNREAANA